MTNICPVCGYDSLLEPAYNNGTPSFEICPACFFEFGYDDHDQGFTFEQWRNKWIEGGMVWGTGKREPPAGWDPRQQLLNIGVKV